MQPGSPVTRTVRAICPRAASGLAEYSGRVKARRGVFKSDTDHSGRRPGRVRLLEKMQERITETDSKVTATVSDILENVAQERGRGGSGIHPQV